MIKTNKIFFINHKYYFILYSPLLKIYRNMEQYHFIYIKLKICKKYIYTIYGDFCWYVKCDTVYNVVRIFFFIII